MPAVRFESSLRAAALVDGGVRSNYQSRLCHERSAAWASTNRKSVPSLATILEAFTLVEHPHTFAAIAYLLQLHCRESRVDRKTQLPLSSTPT